MSKHFILSFALVLFLVSLPVAFSFAQLGSNLPCTGEANDPCTFQSLFTLINNILTYIVKIAVPIGAAIIAYAGIQIVISPGDTSKHKQALITIKVVVLGLLAILASFLIVKTILNTFVIPGLNKL